MEADEKKRFSPQQQLIPFRQRIDLEKKEKFAAGKDGPL